MNLLHEGKVKSVYEIDGEPEKVMMMFHDKVTAGNGRKVEFPEDKGKTCALISALLFEMLAKNGIKTHYIGLPKLDMMECKKLTIIPLEVICRNIAAGSIVRDTPIKEGTVFDPCLVEFNLKNDYLDDPLLTDDRVRLMGFDPHTFRRRATEMNWHFKQIFGRMDIDIVDFKLEYGHDSNGHLYLADEISPDNMRLWKKGTKERFDKDLFRKSEGDIVEAYKYILEQLRGM